MKKIFTLLLAFLSLTVQAQRNQIYSPHIASLQVVAGDDWLSMPIVELGGKINISFDDLTHEYHRYTYTIEHCEDDWSTSRQLLSSDYLNGFAEGNTIDDLQESVNTNVLYTHYSLSLPNDKCAITMSGNYRLTVFDEDSGQKMLTACFMVVEPLMGVDLEVSSNTDADINGRHQQVGMKVSYGQQRVTNPTEQVRTVVLQNGRWDNARRNIRPQYVKSDGLEWAHCRDFIFNAGNEYRKFETLDVNHTTMGLETISWDGTAYHAYVFTDEPRPAYVYDEDANGSFVIRNSDNVEVDNTCEYLYVHFALKSERLDGEVYLNGAWTNDRFLPEYQLQYNDTTHCYEGRVMLKQGYYSYQYLWQKPDGSIHFVPSEGNFFQTENEYQALVYYKGVGERSFRLVGYNKVGTR